jgi:5-methylcytosine-specific restriction endonuclease McrA
MFTQNPRVMRGFCRLCIQTDRMGWRHRLSNIEPDTLTGDCAACGPRVPLRFRKDANLYLCLMGWRMGKGLTALPQKRERKQAPAKRGKHRRVLYLKDRCERCGLAPQDPCVLELDHINGRKCESPHSAENLQTLCANCHRLKTYRPDLFSVAP